MSRFRIDEAKVRELCLKGLTNRQISNRMGQSMEVVNNARRRLGLTSVPTASDSVNTASAKSEGGTVSATNYGE